MESDLINMSLSILALPVSTNMSEVSSSGVDQI